MKYLIVALVTIFLLLLIIVIRDSIIIDSKYYVLEDGKLRKGKEEGDIKIVYFSDVHIGAFIKKKELKKILKLIVNQNADLYLFGGDLLGINTKKYYTIDDIKECFSIFDGKTCLAVYGNHEFKNDNSAPLDMKLKMFDAMGFKVLADSSYTFSKNGINIDIYGLKSYVYNPIKPLDKRYDIVLAHEGDVADYIDNEVILSGHTHGGQIKIPFIPPIYKPRKGKKYCHGLYKVNNTSLILSNGVGFGGMKLRFNAKREIVIISYKKGK